MADGTRLNAGSGGDLIYTDDVTGGSADGTKVQGVKLGLGANGSWTEIPGGGGTEAGSLRVTLASDSTGVLSVDDNGGSLTVDIGTALPAGTNAIGKLAANSGVIIGDVNIVSLIPGTGTTALGKAEDAVHASGDTGVMILAVRADSKSSLASASGDYIPLITASDGSLYTQPDGNIAHDGVDAGNPLKIGGKARTADPATVANLDRVDGFFDILGRQVVAPYTLHENLLQAASSAITTTSSTPLFSAAGVGIRNYVTSLTVVNSHATQGTVVQVLDGSTAIHTGYAAANGGGYSISFPTPLRGTANTALNVQCVSAGANVYASVTGYKAGS